MDVLSNTYNLKLTEIIADFCLTVNVYVALACIVVLGLLGFAYQSTKKPRNLPPGTFGWPVIGCLPFSDLRSYADYYHKKYGDIFCTKMGSRLVVFLSDFHAIKAAFASANVSGRPNFHTFRRLHYFENRGLLFAERRPWSEGRRFALRTLKDFGFGKSVMEASILEEAAELVSCLKKGLGRPIHITHNVNVAAINVIWKIVTGKRYKIEDEVVKKYSSYISDLIVLMTGPAILFDYLPFLEMVVPAFLKRNWMKLDLFDHRRDELRKFYKEIYEEHRKTMNKDSPRDFIDMYLMEVENSKTDPETIFTEDLKGLSAQINDIFGAGSDTTSSTIRWFFLYMAKYPEIQSRAQKEIDECIPGDRMVKLEDKETLHYLQAVIHELHRVITLVPFALPHSVLNDTSIRGYDIPRGSVVCANIEYCHKDKRFWDRPDEFYPEHFLDADGKFYQRKEGFLPFSTGKRACLGEQVARMSLLVFTASILQAFKITAPPGENLRTDPSQVTMMLNWAHPFQVILTERTPIDSCSSKMFD